MISYFEADCRDSPTPGQFQRGGASVEAVCHVRCGRDCVRAAARRMVAEPIAPAKPAKDLLGEWVVVSIDGVKIPEGTTVTVDYKVDGRLFIRQIGGDGSFILPGAPKLKQALDQVDPADRSGVAVNIQAEGFDIRLRRKPATPMPAR